MPIIPGNALQHRLAKQAAFTKRPSNFSRGAVKVVILSAYDSDTFDRDGIPDEIAHLVAREPGTIFAKVRSVDVGKEFFVPLLASEAEILSTHGNAVLLKGMQGTVIYSGQDMKKGKLVLQGEPNKPLKNSVATNVFNVVSYL
jgi:hypothetical protein